MDEDIQAEIHSGVIRAITLDTSIFFQKGLALSNGLLRRVEQFRGSNVAVVLADVVMREVIADIQASIENAKGEFTRAIKSLGRASLLDEEAKTQLSKLDISMGNPRDVAMQRMTSWVEQTEATIVDAASYVSIGDLVNKYFEATPPFTDAGSKKHEFPDALALLALEKWATENDMKILVVSTDDDWKRYCNQSESLVAVNDLADALSGFQDQTAGYAVRRLAELSNKGDPIGLKGAILNAVRTQGDKVEFVVDGDSQYFFEETGVESVFDDIELPNVEDAVEIFEAVQYSDGSVLVLVKCIASVRVISYFQFSISDSYDREYIPMGSSRMVTTESVEIAALVMLGGQVPERMTIDDVEILPCTHHVYYREMVPDWMNDPEKFDYESERDFDSEAGQDFF